MWLLLPDVLNADELAQLRATLACAAWADGAASAGPQAAAVKHNQQLASGSEEARAVQALLQSTVLAALDRHVLFFSAALPRRVLPPSFNRYAGSSNAYGPHVDQAIRHHPHTGQALRADIACTLFISDPASYDGGELVVHGAGSPPRQAKLAAGAALVYGARHVHHVAPVTRGERLASFFWVESMVRSDEQRELLFDMDMALMRLRQQHGESAETVALTGTYHNLLRLWATP